MGTFGYNCRLGKCDFVATEDTNAPQVLFYGIGFTLPCLLTTVSYICIWAYVRWRCYKTFHGRKLRLFIIS